MAGWMSMKKSGALRSHRYFCVLHVDGGRSIFYYFSNELAAKPRGFIKFEVR